MDNTKNPHKVPSKIIILKRKNYRNGSQEEILLRNLRTQQGMIMLGFYSIAELCFWIEAKLDCPECFKKII